MTDLQPCPEQGLQNPALTNFAKPKKDQTPRKERIRTHGKEKDSSPWPTPIYKLSMTSTVWNISIASLG